MDTLTLVIIFLSFGLSFIFALGGVGSALILIPTLTWLGVPFGLAHRTFCQYREHDRGHLFQHPGKAA
jgi:hypothetical protein